MTDPVTAPVEQPTPREADYRWFTVHERPQFSGGGYEVRVHKYLAYLFQGGHGSSDGTRPGWLGATRFGTFDEAVAFGQQLAVHVELAQKAHGEQCDAVRAATDLIYREYGQRSRLGVSDAS